MTTDFFNAWLIHKQPRGETSYRLTLFTREQGIISCLYRGGRRSKMQSAVQVFMPVLISTSQKHEQYFLQSIESHAAPFMLEGTALFSALYLNELLYYLLKSEDPYPELFDSYEQTLFALSAQPDKQELEMILRRFEWSLISFLGVLCAFDEEAISRHPIQPDSYYSYDPQVGFMNNNQTGLPGYAILALSEGRLEDAYVLKAAKLIMRRTIDALLEGRVLKSRELFF